MTPAGDSTPPATPAADHLSVSHGQQAIVPDVAPQANTTGLNTVSVSFPSGEHSSTSAVANTLAIPSTSSAIATSPMTHLSVAHKLQAPLLAQRAISTISTASDATSLSLNTEYRGPIIPPACDKEYCDARTLVICFDGTGDEFDQDNSNVVKFFSLLKKGDHNRQLCYYQSGIGTYTIPQVATPLYSAYSKTLDLMFAKNLNFHVMSGYKFLMQNYRDGDKICIFGFSRGAYTARSLAGMIHKVGLLPEGNEQQVPFAYRMYMRDDMLGWKQSVLFKSTFSIDVDIEFVGVWDTVASVGLIPYNLPFTQSNTAIKTFRHAVALDEHRVKFKPSLHRWLSPEEARRQDSLAPPQARSRRGTVDLKEVVLRREAEPGRIKGGVGSLKGYSSLKKGHNRVVSDSRLEAVKKEELSFITSSVLSKLKTDDNQPPLSSENGSPTQPSRNSDVAVADSFLARSSGSLSRRTEAILKKVKIGGKEGSDEGHESPTAMKEDIEAQFMDMTSQTDVEEVWFAGCHCDVGGGSVANDTEHSLARIPLRWMIRQCFLARTGIQFKAEELRAIGLEPDTLYPRVIVRANDDDERGRTMSKRTARLDDSKVQSDVSTTVKIVTEAETATTTTSTTTMSSETKRRSWFAPKMSRHWRFSSGDGTLVDRRPSMSTSTSVSVSGGGKPDGTSHSEKVTIDVELPSDNGRSADVLSGVEGLPVTPTTPYSSTHSSSRSPSRHNNHRDCSSSSSHKQPQTHDKHAHLPTTPHKKPNYHHHHHTNTNKYIRVVSSEEADRLLRHEMEQDELDAQQPIYDQLEIKKAWWVVEFMPWSYRAQMGDGSWKKKWGINRGKPRVIPQLEGPLRVHRSVGLRIKDKDLMYTPRVKFEREPIWVD